MTPDLDAALRALPHGREFRFVHRLTALDPGKTGAGEYVPEAGAEFFRGHFPGEPIVPGVLLIEAVAQLGGVVAQSDPTVPPLAGMKLTAVRNAKITGTARPEETVSLRAEVVARMGGLVQVSGTASVGGSVVLRCEVTLSGSPG